MSVDPLRLLLQGLVLLLLAAALGYLSHRPAWQAVAADHSTLKLMVRHSGKRVGECSQLTDADLQAKAPNMRQITVCPREKSPLAVQLLVDDVLIVDQVINPSGIHDDGVLAYYQAFQLPLGMHRIEFRAWERASDEQTRLSAVADLRVSRDSNVVIQLNDQGIEIYQPALSGGA